jgi:hypothetical protein
MIIYLDFLTNLGLPPLATTDLAPLEGTPPDIANGLAFNAPLIVGPTGPEGGCNLEDAGRFGMSFFIFVFLVIGNSFFLFKS